jgi:hypothetical protein
MNILLKNKNNNCIYSHDIESGVSTNLATGASGKLTDEQIKANMVISKFEAYEHKEIIVEFITKLALYETT